MLRDEVRAQLLNISQVLTDVATSWTECLALPHRSQEAVVQALDAACRLLPFSLLGLDTDNGSEFLTLELVACCEREQITFTTSKRDLHPRDRR